MLDHLAEGRLNFGVAASGLPSDWAMFNVDGMSGQNREMTREALDIILRLWTDPEPFDHKGKYWSVSKTDAAIIISSIQHMYLVRSLVLDLNLNNKIEQW